MHNFILKRQPKSYNGWSKTSNAKKESYKEAIYTSFKNAYPTHSILKDDLYGILYYFFKKDYKTDADNVSKPLWDCLSGFLYNDDEQVRIRIAGTFNLMKHDFNILDLSGLAGNIVGQLLEAFDNEDHIIYIECGELDNSLFKFNLEVHEN